MVKFNKFQSSLVKLSGTSSIDVLVTEIVAYIRTTIKNISLDKIDPSLLRFICNIVENSYSKKNSVDNKIDKKKIVIDVYCTLKPSANNSDDKVMVDKLIEDLHSSGQILKVSSVRYYWKVLTKHFLSKKE